MTKKMIDESTEVVFIPAEGTSATLCASFTAVNLTMVSEAEFRKYADEALAEFRKGAIKPVQSSAELL